jgi:hypothetical protein
MPDWQELVRQRLSSLALDAEEKDEVQVELAAHLEESYEVFCKEGLPEKEAVYRTFEQVADWRDLQRRIFNRCTDEWDWLALGSGNRSFGRRVARAAFV